MRTRQSSDRRRRGFSMLILVDIGLLLAVLVVAAHTFIASRLQTLGPAARYQQTFWQARADELCEREGVPRLPPLPADGDATDQLAFLDGLTGVSNRIWQMHQNCEEPRSIVLPEDLLHFRVDKYDEYETSPEPAFATIRNAVNEHLKARNQIYVLGHTDDTATDQHNYELSYKRALEVARVIERHLTGTLRLKARQDFALYPVGLGESQLLGLANREEVGRWRTRCRRIEISFRAAPTKRQAER